MKNILVTGGAGYIGSKVSHDLIDRGYKIIIVDDLSNSKKKLVPSKAIFKKIDITKIKLLEKVFKKYNFHSIFHFAAKKNISESQKDPLKYFKSNVIGTKNLLDLVIKYKVKNFIFSSTCAVYGNCLNTRVSEKSTQIPENYYGYTKLISEDTIIKYNKKNNFNFAILRFFNVVGADKNQKVGEVNYGSLFKNISEAIKKNKLLHVYGKDYNTKDGTCVRDYIDLNDLSKLHLLALKKINISKKSIIFNCGYSKPLSVLDVIQNFEKVLKRKILINFKKRRQGDIEKIYSNNHMQRKLFPNWKRKFSLLDSIKSTLQWENII
jgi:UDP-glucose 4-epimerase